MRILLLAPVHREKEYLEQKGNLPFLRGQGQQSWVEALQELGHKVFVFRYSDSILVPNKFRVFISGITREVSPQLYSKYLRFSNRFYFLSIDIFLKNQKLLHLAHKTRPELIVISGGITSIYPRTIKTIKGKFLCRVLLFAGVNPLISVTKVEKEMLDRGIIDVVVENDKGYAKRWEKLGAKKTIVLPISSCDPKIHKKVRLSNGEKKEYGCDVCFVGTLTPDRQENLVELTRINLDTRLILKIWGDVPLHVRLREELKPYYRGTAFGEEMVKIFNAAKIVLNFQPQDMTHGGNMRTFEILGCHAFQLANKIDTDFLTNGREFVSFNNLDDLKHKINYYLQNDDERLKIAESGFKRVQRDHTYEKHFKKLLSQI